MKITINNQVIEIEYNTLIAMIISGAISQDAEIIIETKKFIWTWNKRIDYSPTVAIFDPVALK
tara:strand:- start:921 stop:1109 length:189 start_codon:yes stop_codon:yes gene_type:complete